MTSQLLLRRLVDQAGGPRESGYVLVLDGEGLEDLGSELSTQQGTYAVHRVGTELGLRHLLWKAKGAPLIAVLPEKVATQVVKKAPDLLRRAHKQRIHALLINDVLEAKLGVRVVGADTEALQKLALEYLPQLELRLHQRTLPTVVDRKLLTEMLVEACAGEHLRTTSPASLLREWIQAPPTWSEAVTTLVTEALPGLHGDEGRLLAWALREPEGRLKDLVRYGAVLTVEAPELPKPVWGPFWRAATEPPLELDHRILRRTLARLAEDTLVLLEDAAVPLLAEADRIGREHLTPSQLQSSRVLPLAFLDKCHALAQQAAAGRSISSGEITWLETHRAAPMHQAELAVLKTIARVSRYLDQPFSAKLDLLEQLRDYHWNGAFADLAMADLRKALANSSAYHVEANKLLTDCRERRDRENLQFAQALKANYEAGLHREGITPLHRLWKRTVAPMWEEQPTMKLFLVVLDGCSYPVFLELLQALAQDAAFPVGVRPGPDGRVAGLPALSPLPTITSHARGAIFLGELPQDPLVAETVFRDQEEAKTDKARFNQNAALGSKARRLFLKGDLADGGQGLFAALEDPALAVVAAVFNAVDDQIGSSNTGAFVRLRPEEIAGFKPALKKALHAGRRVLLTADHGHSHFVETGLRMGAGKSSRFLPLGPHDPVPDGFMEIDVAGLGGPPERRAFACRSGVYLGNPQVGFHGGCSLEEMAVPLAWLEPNGLAADQPLWWLGAEAHLPRPEPAQPMVLQPVTPVPSDVPKSAKGRHMSLFDLEDRAETLPLPEDVLQKLSVDERKVLVLLKENGTAKTTDLATLLGKAPGRMNGFMVQLKKTLFTFQLELFQVEVLPSGEPQFKYTGKEGL